MAVRDSLSAGEGHCRIQGDCGAGNENPAGMSCGVNDCGVQIGRGLSRLSYPALCGLWPVHGFGFIFRLLPFDIFTPKNS